MKVAIGGDHAGFEYKKIILNWLQEQNFETADFGPYTPDSFEEAFSTAFDLDARLPVADSSRTIYIWRRR